MPTTRSSSRDGTSSEKKKRARKRVRLRRDASRSSSSSSGSGSAGGWTRHGTALPSWTDLEPSTRRPRDASEESFLQRLSTTRFAVLVLLVAGVFTLYIGHVHATADLLDQLQEARTENRRLHLKHNRLKGEFDRRTGPAVIYERAHELGLRASVTYGPPLSIDE